MEHLMKMRTRFQLNQTIVWKGKNHNTQHRIYKGKVVGLHDDFVFIREILVSSDGVLKIPGNTYRVDFEDVIARV